MNLSLLQSIFSAYQLGESIEPPIAIRKNRVWKVCTEKGFFKIKNVLPSEFENVIQGDQIANHFQKKRIPAEIALPFLKSPIFTVQEKHFYVAPWHEGFVSPNIAFSEAHAYQAGLLMARMHAINLQLPGVTSAQWQNFMVPDWRSISKKIAKKKMSYAHSFENAVPELIAWSDLYRKGRRELEAWYVISHGDLLPANIVWSSQTTPFIVDWEAAGYIHPQVELWSAALNWSGILWGEVKTNLFIKILEGYRSIGMPILFDEKIVYTGLGSWLAWLVYKVAHSHIFHSEINIEEDVWVLRRIVRSFSNLIFLSRQI
jgi:Ser/Thr protein kinase RdoA (MazF antagonist)